MYVTYDYYLNDFSGSNPIVTPEKWDRLEAKAEMLIDMRTNGAWKNYTDDKRVMDCICELCESVESEQLANKNGAVASESVGPHSISYKVKSSIDYAKEREDIFIMYLLRLNILSRVVFQV